MQALTNQSSALRLPDTSDLHWLILPNGDADFHDNIILFGFNPNASDPVLVAKVPRLVENSWMIQVEYERLVDLGNLLGQDAELFVPIPLALAKVQERSALLLPYVPGQSLTRLSKGSFWGNHRKVAGLAAEAARALRQLHDRTATPARPGAETDSDFYRAADKFREIFPLSEREDRALSSLAELVSDTVLRSSHHILIQGDFWHGNMIREQRRGGLRFVDWQFARRSADASMDVYFFLLAGAFSASEAGSSPERRAAEAGRVLGAWRTQIIPEYLAIYGRPTNYALLPLKPGLLMCCVEKAVRPALDFGYTHSDDRVWRQLFSELLDWPDGN